jgi:hypothetical protein
VQGTLSEDGSCISQVARMSGTGGQLYSALSHNRPSEAQMLKAQMMFCEYCPFIQVPHIFANHAIMQAFTGAQRVHIIDYGILYGVQWPCLLHQLSQREGGPPHLRITGMSSLVSLKRRDNESVQQNCYFPAQNFLSVLLLVR